MNYRSLHEDKKRGTYDFPVELYHVDFSSARYQMPLHWHLEYELILVLSGRIHLSLDGKQYWLEAGDSAWIGDGVIHGGVPETCVYECVVFDFTALLRNTLLCAKSAGEFLSNSSSYTGPLRKGSAEAHIVNEIFEIMKQEQKGYEWITLGLLWQLMGNLLGSTAEKPIPSAQNRQQIVRMKAVLSFIRDNYSQPITLGELAGIAGMSPRYFCRAFSAMTGKTPMAYLIYYRIECAGERLRLSDEPITEIAFACGFNDMSYFAKQFKRYKNATPSQYRKLV